MALFPCANGRVLIQLFALVLYVGMAFGGPSHGSKGTPMRSIPASSVLTSIVELRVDLDCGTVDLVAMALTAEGKELTFRKVLPSSYFVDEDPHHSYCVDPNDNYFEDCHRVLYSTGKTEFIAGYATCWYDRNHADPSYSDFEGALSVDWGFDIKNREFWIRPENLLPLPVPFRLKKWTGLHFLIPAKLRDFSQDDARDLIQNRGGIVVHNSGPVDVVVLPDRIDFCSRIPRSTNKVAEFCIRKGAKVLWERHFLRPEESPPPIGGDEWRD